MTNNLIANKPCNNKKWLTYALVTEAHCAGFTLAQKEKAAIRLNEGRTGAIFGPAAHFTRVLRLWKKREGGKKCLAEQYWTVLNHCNDVFDVLCILRGSAQANSV